MSNTQQKVDISGLASLFEAENEEGNVEYKAHLIDPSEERIERLTSQMKYRLAEGNGEALYRLGVSDDGHGDGLTEEELAESMETMKILAEKNNAEATIVHHDAGLMEGHSIVEVMVRSNLTDNDTINLKVAVIGNVDSGKSTIVSVLSKGGLDNGRGLARVKCFNFKHEIDTGRTSSVSADNFVGFNNEGIIMNYNEKGKERRTEEILEESTKLVNFIDLAGHEPYLKTTIFGMTACYPDYSMLLIGANMGVQKMTKEHLGLTIALNIPLFVVITKLDIAPENKLKETLDEITKNLKKPGVRKTPYIVKNEQNVIVCSKQMGEGSTIVPIFQVSNVTGEGLDLLKMFLNLLPSKREWTKLKELPSEFLIDSVFNVPGVAGVVVAGTLTKGVIASLKNDDTIMMLGPFNDGTFKKVQVKGIHSKCIPVGSISAGCISSLAIKFANSKEKLVKKMIRKGMVLVDPSINPKSAYMFRCEVVILHHSGTIKTGYEPILHIGNIRQAASIYSMNQELLRTGGRALMRMRFKHWPEYISEGTMIVFRENHMKAVGIIRKVIYDESNILPRKKPVTKRQRKRNARKHDKSLLKQNADAKARHNHLRRKGPKMPRPQTKPSTQHTNTHETS